MVNTHFYHVQYIFEMILGKVQKQTFCGNGISCKNVCGDTAEEAFTVDAENTDVDWCDLEKPSSTERRKRCVCHLPVFLLGWCTSVIQTSSSLQNYRVCCLHWFIYNNIQDASSVCCGMGICF